jgi:hypothetical protein
MQTPIVTETARLSAHRRQVELVRASLVLNVPASREERVPPPFRRQW